MKNKSGLLWSLVFIVIFLLSQDYLFTTWEGKLSFFGFPDWFAWFTGVHLIFIFCFFLFSKKHWQ